MAKLSDLEFEQVTIVYRNGVTNHHRCRYSMEAGPSGFLLTVIEQGGDITVVNFDDVVRVHLTPAAVQSVGKLHRVPMPEGA